MFLYIFSYSTPKVQSIETQQPIAMPQCLSVVARTNESQVGFLTYRNEMLNFFIAIFSNKYMLYYLFSYSTPKLQSIEAQQPLHSRMIIYRSAYKPESCRVFDIYE